MLPIYTRPLLYDYMTFPFRTFIAEVWLCLGIIIALRYAIIRIPTLAYLKKKRVKVCVNGSKRLEKLLYSQISLTYTGITRFIQLLMTLFTSVLFVNLYRNNLLLSIVKPNAEMTPNTLKEVVDAVEEGSLRFIFPVKDDLTENVLLSSAVDDDPL